MESKICIVVSSNIKHSTLMSIYTKILNDRNIPYDIIYFDRYDIVEKNKAARTYKFTKKMDSNQKQIKKLPVFLDFRKFAKKILNKNQYELIIVWNTFTAMILLDYLMKKNVKYILNIRDYYYENNKVVFLLHKKLIKNSLFTTISSKGFLSFLPQHDYIYVNSANVEILPEKPPKKIVKKKTEINIGFIGNVRFFNELKNIMTIFKNDNRFVLWFCGANSEYLQNFADENKIYNCKFVGHFEPGETAILLSNFDFINNLFGESSESVKYLTSIRLYYSTFFHIPILVNQNTYMGNIVDENGIGISLNVKNKNIKEEVYEWYKNLNYEEFIRKCEEFNFEIKQQNSVFNEKFNITLDNIL